MKNNQLSFTILGGVIKMINFPKKRYSKENVQASCAIYHILFAKKT